MQSDWTVACGADDPTVVVPWRSCDGSVRYVDLRATPFSLEEIPEAVRYSSVAAALHRWNQPDARIFTTKCDLWNYAADLFDAEDLPDYAFAHASYIDLLPIAPEIFFSFAHCEALLRACTKTARGIEIDHTRCEWTLRPARIFPNTPATYLSFDDPHTDGFAITLYVWGYGVSPEAAESAWSSALLTLVEPVIRTVDFYIPANIR